MYLLDVKYASLLSNQLERFQQQKRDPYQARFRCPICGDSKKDKHKARGYLYKKDDGLSYKCHNCGAAHKFYAFLKTVNLTLWNEYKAERFFERDRNRPLHLSPRIPPHLGA